MYDDLITLSKAAEHLAGPDPIARRRRFESLRKAAQRGRLAATLIPSRGGGTYVTTPDDLARYTAEVEAWRLHGRQPRERRRPADRLTRPEIEELVP